MAEYGDAVQFGVLGPLQVIDGSGTVIAVPAAKQRIVLAALLLDTGSMVSAASLADALWDGRPPPNARAAMRTYVMRLRRALGPAGGRIVGRPSGWAVQLDHSGQLDVAEVDRLWRAARAAGEADQWRQVSPLLTRALSLWRGEPLADVPSTALARREAGRLAELRLQLTEARIDADLRLGRHGELVAELRRLAADHPLREHVRAQLMLACYRCGHQAAALEVYRDARSTLAEELGVEPGHELRGMHQRILTADPDLLVSASATVTAGPPLRDHPQLPGLDVAVPHQLPATIPHFTGRPAELARLTALARRAQAEGPAVLVIAGMAGVGKTALAVHWAHRVAGLFPDGQLYVNLAGFAPTGEPADPAALVRGLLEALGVAAGKIPASPQAQSGLYHSLLDGKRMLVVLDNARDAAQVRPLLPGAPECLVVVTSRNQLTGLAATAGAQILALDVLTGAEARKLLAERVGTERVRAEPEAVSELVSSCAGLPLALAITAARAVARPHHPLAALAAKLRDAGSRLDALDEDDAASSVRAVFSWSYSRLSPAAARMFRLLGLHPGPVISAAAAASLAGMPVAQASRLLAELAHCHLLAEPAPGRYTLHDLLRAYAAEHVVTTHTLADRQAAAARLLDHYAQTAHNAARLISPGVTG